METESSISLALNFNEESSDGFPEDIRRAGEEMEKEIVQEEDEKEAQAIDDEDLDEKEQRAIRYKRLMHLLDRSKFYSNFLLERMAAKKEEEKIKQEKIAKRLENKKLKLEKENELKERDENDSKQVTVNETPSSARKRGAKRQHEAKDATESKPNKRSRKVKLTETSILNVIDQEELEKRAAKEESEDEEAVEEVKSEEKEPDLFDGGTMRPYQIDGFRWLVSLYENGMNGILADEMGLGKTVQCIALVSHLMDKGVVGPFLVCAPLSTLPNWLSEFKRFTPRIPTVLYHGNQEKRDDLLPEIKQKFRIPGYPGVKYFPVVITSFEVIIRDRAVLERFQWRYIIVDEGHRLKNYQCRFVQELKKYPSSNRLLLTGTPLQNNLTELWSLLNFLLPEIFDDLYVFQSWFRVEELKGSDGERKILEMEQKEHVLSMLHQILSPFLLRRLKSDVDLQIPPKKELLVYCPMSKTQEQLYRATVDRTIANILGLEREKVEEEEVELQENGRRKRKAKKEVNYAAMGSSEAADDNLPKISNRRAESEILEWTKMSDELTWALRQPKEKSKLALTTNVKMQNTMMMLRKIVNHPYLVKWEVDEAGDYLVNKDMIYDSGKLAVVDQMLKRLIKDGHRVLIFSQMTMMLDILADYLDMEEIKFCRLDGRMNLEERGKCMDIFKNDPSVPVFLVSTRAGGLGINLTSADTVIIYDSDWNPQCDLQAQDRCHRIGQTKPVAIYRLITADTIDQRVIDTAGAKRKLEKLVIQKGKFKSGIPHTNSAQNGSGLSVNELMELLKSKDHNAEYRGVSGQVFTEDEMNALMDRSDLTLTEKKPQVKEEMMKMEGVFKRVDQPSE